MCKSGSQLISKFKSDAKRGCGVKTLVNSICEGKFNHVEYVCELLNALNTVPVEVAKEVAARLEEQLNCPRVRLTLSQMRHNEMYVEFLQRTGR